MSQELKVRKQKSEVKVQVTVDRRAKSIFCLLFTVFCLTSSAVYAERIKDIASFEGVRDNQLIGYGLVVGLDGSGDKGQAAAAEYYKHAQQDGIEY